MKDKDTNIQSYKICVKVFCAIIIDSAEFSIVKIDIKFTYNPNSKRFSDNLAYPKIPISLDY